MLAAPRPKVTPATRCAVCGKSNVPYKALGKCRRCYGNAYQRKRRAALRRAS